MFRSWIAQLLSVLLVGSVPLPAPARHMAQQKAPTIQEQLVLMQAGSVVEVKTKAKKKVKGRLGALGADSFEVQTAKAGSVVTESFRFDDVKSVKHLEKETGMGTATKVTLGVLAGVGVVFLIIIIACAAGGCYS